MFLATVILLYVVFSLSNSIRVFFTSRKYMDKVKRELDESLGNAEKLDGKIVKIGAIIAVVFVVIFNIFVYSSIAVYMHSILMTVLGGILSVLTFRNILEMIDLFKGRNVVVIDVFDYIKTLLSIIYLMTFTSTYAHSLFNPMTSAIVIIIMIILAIVTGIARAAKRNKTVRA